MVFSSRGVEKGVGKAFLEREGLSRAGRSTWNGKVHLDREGLLHGRVPAPEGDLPIWPGPLPPPGKAVGNGRMVTFREGRSFDLPRPRSVLVPRRFLRSVNP
jgi:hypothetical protein